MVEAGRPLPWNKYLSSALQGRDSLRHLDAAQWGYCAAPPDISEHARIEQPHQTT